MWIKKAFCDGKDASWLKGLEDLSEGCLTMGHLTKNRKEDGSVELFGGELSLSSPRSLETSIRDPRSLRALFGSLYPSGINVDPNHRACGANLLRHGNRQSARTTSYIDHVHSRPERKLPDRQAVACIDE
jgi:hypothetical protein